MQRMGPLASSALINAVAAPPRAVDCSGVIASVDLDGTAADPVDAVGMRDDRRALYDNLAVLVQRDARIPALKDNLLPRRHDKPLTVGVDFNGVVCGVTGPSRRLQTSQNDRLRDVATLEDEHDRGIEIRR